MSSETTGEGSDPSQIGFWGPIALVVVVLAVYIQSASFGFIYDDSEVILRQHSPQSLIELGQIFAEPHFEGLPYYRPLTRATLLVQKSLHGEHPALFHVANTILMALAAILAYALLRLPAFGTPRLVSLFGAAVFALHPIASCCVYPISSGRETLMPGVWMLGATYGFLRGGRAGYAIAILGFSGSLFCKEQAVILPVIFILADLLQLPGGGTPQRWRWLWRYLPFTMVLVAYFLIRSTMFGGREYDVAVLKAPLNVILSFVYLIQTVFAPFAELVYEPKSQTWLSIPRLFFGASGVIVLGYSAKSWSERRITLFWLAWLVLLFLPTSNLLRQDALFAERYGFLSSLAVIGITLNVISAHWESVQVRRWFTTLACLATLCCGATSVYRGQFFRDDIAFCNQWIRTDPLAANPHITLGDVYHHDGRLEEATEHISISTRLMPEWSKGRVWLGHVLSDAGKLEQALASYRAAIELNPSDPHTYYSLGLALARQKKPTEAIDCFLQAVRIQPDYIDAHVNLGVLLAGQGKLQAAIEHYRKALALSWGCAEAHYNMGIAQMKLNRESDAIQCFVNAVRFDPAHINAHVNLAAVLSIRGETSRSIQHCAIALSLDPNLPEAHYNMGMALGSKGDLKSAAEHYRRALVARPRWALAAMRLSLILATAIDDELRDGQEAVRLAELALEQFGPDDSTTPESENVVAAAYAAVNRFEEAVSTAQKALQGAEFQKQEDLVQQIRLRLNLYESGQPCRLSKIEI